MVVPDPVDHDAGGQGVVWVGDPFCKLETALALRRIRGQAKIGSEGFEGGESACRHLISMAIDVTPDEKERGIRLLGIGGIGKHGFRYTENGFTQTVAVCAEGISQAAFFWGQRVRD